MFTHRPFKAGRFLTLISAVVLALAVLLPATASARTHSSANAAKAARPALSVSGYTLRWRRVPHARAYQIAAIRGRKVTLRTVHSTDYLPPKTPGKTVHYKLRVLNHTKWGKPVTINYPKTTTTTPVSTSGGPLRVAVMNITGHSYIPNELTTVRNAGISWDRIDVGNGSDISLVQQAHNEGIKALVLYNPGLAGMAPATVAAQVKSLAQQILPLGLTEIEFGNEVYYNGSTPQTYAAQYNAAHQALAGMGITLIANSYGDYKTASGSWSQDANGGGWIHDFISALPGGASEVDAWSVHPYGPMGTITNGDDSGWGMVARYHGLATQYGSSAPWYITEVNQCMGGSTCTTPTSQAGQAAAMTTYLTSTLTMPYVKYIDFYSISDDSTGQFGLLNSDGTPRPAFTALAGFMSSHASQLAG